MADRADNRTIAASGTGIGGAIVLDRRGNHAFSFTDQVMYREVIRDDGAPCVAIHS